MVKKLIFGSEEFSRPKDSCRFPLIVFQQATQPFLASHDSVIPARPSIRHWEQEPVLLALVIALLVVMGHPPSSTPSLGDFLNSHNISWKYHGDQWNNYVPDPYRENYGVNGPNADEYCNICNPFQYDTSIMSNPAQVAAHLQDTVNLYSDITSETLPAVSIVKPSGYTDGHPSSSKLDLFELFTQKIVNMVQASPYWQNTAIFITFDEGGGYYDSGYIQPVDFFGDGTRIPLLIVSPYSTGGNATHGYADHVHRQIHREELNIGTITSRSRDNFPNPVTSANNPYVSLNSPALDDLFDAFNFPTK